MLGIEPDLSVFVGAVPLEVPKEPNVGAIVGEEPKTLVVGAAAKALVVGTAPKTFEGMTAGEDAGDGLNTLEACAAFGVVDPNGVNGAFDCVKLKGFAAGTEGVAVRVVVGACVWNGEVVAEVAKGLSEVVVELNPNVGAGWTVPVEANVPNDGVFAGDVCAGAVLAPNKFENGAAGFIVAVVLNGEVPVTVGLDVVFWLFPNEKPVLGEAVVGGIVDCPNIDPAVFVVAGCPNIEVGCCPKSGCMFGWPNGEVVCVFTGCVCDCPKILCGAGGCVNGLVGVVGLNDPNERVGGVCPPTGADADDWFA